MIIKIRRQFPERARVNSLLLFRPTEASVLFNFSWVFYNDKLVEKQYVSQFRLQSQLDALFTSCLTKYLSWKKRIYQHTKDTLFGKVQEITEIGIVFFFFSFPVSLIASQKYTCTNIGSGATSLGNARELILIDSKVGTGSQFPILGLFNPVSYFFFLIFFFF